MVDLFSGVGGMSLGAARAGFEVRSAVELDPIAASTHTINFPQTRHLQWDVGRTVGSDLLEKAGILPGQLDGLVGGPPCQGFSDIGKRAHDDPRNSLFEHFFRLVGELRPRFFVAENVPGILAGRNAAAVASALSRVPSSYRMFAATELAAHRWGAATTRARVFFVGYDPERTNAMTAEALFEQANESTVTVGDALLGLPRIRSDWQREDQGWRKVDLLDDTNDFYRRLTADVPFGVGCPKALERLRCHGEVSGNLGTLHTKTVVKRFNRVRPGSTDPISRATRLRFDGFCPTLRAGTASDRGSFQAVRPIHHSSPRVITPREAARLQGFPDWFQFHGTKWHSFRQIGNSVSPIVGETLLSRIRAYL